MPAYDYRCNECSHEFETQQSIKDKPLKKCPECKKNKLERLISAPTVFVRQDAKTLGQQADRNTKKMGRYEKQAVEKANSDKRIKVKKENPWWKSEHSVDKIANLGPEAKQRYIMEGKII